MDLAPLSIVLAPAALQLLLDPAAQVPKAAQLILARAIRVLLILVPRTLVQATRAPATLVVTRVLPIRAPRILGRATGAAIAPSALSAAAAAVVAEIVTNVLITMKTA